MITIVDYGMGNLESIHNMFKKLGYPSVITSDPEAINGAEKVILPGVGHFGKAMDIIHETGLKAILDDLALRKKVPVLGICLGMQLLYDYSEEGNRQGLGWISGNVVRFKSDNHLKVPHMGWSPVKTVNRDGLFAGFEEDIRFYFVHSYYVHSVNIEDVSATCTYGVEFTCAAQKNNIYATQFHPEKSHKYGMRLLENFAKTV